MPWAFIVGAIRFATNSLTSNSSLLTKINCPRIVFPVSAVLSALFDMLVATIPLVVVLAFTGIRPAASQLWVIPLLLLIVSFVAGLGIALSAANLYFRDVKYIVEVLLTFAIFFTRCSIPHPCSDLGATCCCSTLSHRCLRAWR